MGIIADNEHALHVTGGPNVGGQVGDDLQSAMLTPVVAAAVEFWAAQGVSAGDLAMLAWTTIRIAAGVGREGSAGAVDGWRHRARVTGRAGTANGTGVIREVHRVARRARSRAGLGAGIGAGPPVAHRLACRTSRGTAPVGIGLRAVAHRLGGRRDGTDSVGGEGAPAMAAPAVVIH
jgi:hypothetical protein